MQYVLAQASAPAGAATLAATTAPATSQPAGIEQLDKATLEKFKRLLDQMENAPAENAQATATSGEGRKKENPQLATALYVRGDYYIGRGWLELRPQNLIPATAALLLMVLLGWLIVRVFRTYLTKNKLTRPVNLGALALGIYFAVFVWHPGRLNDAHDLLGLFFHKAVAAAILVMGIRILDRLVIVNILTRGGKVHLSKFIHQIVVFVVCLFVGMAYISWAFGVDVTAILAGSAVISIILGLALQETLGNFFSGMVMQASSPFQIGDWIQVGGLEGRVVDMNWRAVTIHTAEDNYVIVPNGTVAKEQIINFHSPTKATARSISVGLEYELTPNEAREVLMEAALETEGVLHDPAPIVYLDNYADSAIVYRVKFWIDHPARHVVIENAVRVNAWYRLKRKGFGIPFQIQTVEFVNLDRKMKKEADRAAARRELAIKKNPLFAKLDAEQLRHLAKVSRDVVLCAGQTVYRQGEMGDTLFLVQEGAVDVFIKGDDGKAVDVGDIEAGSFFGELSAMTGQPRPATIRAKNDVTCIEIGREDLVPIFEKDPELMTHISHVIAQRQAERDRQMADMGAKKAPAPVGTHQPNVLERMRGLFKALKR